MSTTDGHGRSEPDEVDPVAGTDAGRQATAHDPAAAAMTSPTGTPYPVDISGDIRSRWIWPLFIGGPVIWFVHFMVVYLVAEAGCTGSGPGLEQLAPPVPRVVSVVATVVAVLACLALALVAHRRRRSQQAEAAHAAPGDDDPSGPAGADRSDIFLAGIILSLLSAGSVLAVGVPAPLLPAC